MRYGGYIVPRSGGQQSDGAVLKAISLVGSGAKALKYFVFGPEYNFPGNCYSESLVGNPDLLQGMAKAHTLIADAEPLLWPAERVRAQVCVRAQHGVKLGHTPSHVPQNIHAPHRFPEVRTCCTFATGSH